MHQNTDLARLALRRAVYTKPLTELADRSGMCWLIFFQAKGSACSSLNTRSCSLSPQGPTMRKSRRRKPHRRRHSEADLPGTAPDTSGQSATPLPVSAENSRRSSA